MHHPFLFLALPKELRFMVYELLCVLERNHPLVYVRPHLRGDAAKPDEESSGVGSASQSSDHKDRPCITLVTNVLDAQILATCRQINAEATPFIRPKLEWIKAQIPRIKIDAECSCELLSRTLPHLICALLGYLHAHCTAASLEDRTSEKRPEIVYLEPALRWVDHTAVRLLAQLHNAASLIEDSSSPEVRILLEIRKVVRVERERRRAPQGQAQVDTNSNRLHVFGASSMSTYDPSTSALLAQAFNDAFQMARVRGLNLVRGGSLVFDHGCEQILSCGFVEVQTCVLGYQIAR